MAWTGSGTYVLNALYYPEVNGTVIDAVRYNGLLADVQGGISAALAKNGENAPTANLPMGGFKHTGVANATGAGQYVAWGQDATLGALTVTSISGSGTSLTALNASNLGSGTIPDARFPATLPALSGVNLTALNASNVASGTLANARTTATSANTASAIVARDASGNFSAGTITATLSGNATSATTATQTTAAVTFNNSGSGVASGTTFNGSTARTISYNTIGAAPSATTVGSTWTPTPSGLSNLGSVTINSARYHRIGNIVKVSVSFSCSITTGGDSATQFQFTLPIASNFTALQDASGVCAFNSTAAMIGYAVAGTTSDTIIITWAAKATGNLGGYFEGSYEVK